VNERLESLLRRYHDVSAFVADPELVKDQKKYRDTMKEYAYLHELSTLHTAIETATHQIEETKILIQDEKDAEMRELAREEMRELELNLRDSEERLKFLLIPRDPLDEKNIIMEIRAGTGGEEAALFAADLFRMYSRFAETRGWKFEIMNLNETELGGYKEIVFSISGSNVYENLRYESGAHRVQRLAAGVALQRADIRAHVKHVEVTRPRPGFRRARETVLPAKRAVLDGGLVELLRVGGQPVVLRRETQAHTVINSGAHRQRRRQDHQQQRETNNDSRPRQSAIKPERAPMLSHTLINSFSFAAKAWSIFAP
jgi:hypothetical protein